MSERLDPKYFASDHDKFLFWMEDGYIKFEKFSAVYGSLEDDERLPLFREAMALPEMEWGAFTLRDGQDKQMRECIRDKALVEIRGLTYKIGYESNGWEYGLANGALEKHKTLIEEIG